MPAMLFNQLTIVNFWDKVLREFELHEVFWFGLIIILASGLALQFALKGQRYIRSALVFFILYVTCVPIAVLLEANHFSVASKLTILIGKLFCEISFINLGSLILFDLILSKVRLKIPHIVRDILVLIAYAIVTLSLLTSLGVNVTSIIATSAVITAVIGLSLQDTLGNIMAGLALQLENIIQIGDWVKIDQYTGRVKEVRWRQTSIKTRNWDTVIIPNSQIMKGQVIIYGQRDGKLRLSRRWVYFNVDFRFNPSEVIECIDRAIQNTEIENVAKDPQPHTILVDFKESYCQYAVRYWLNNLAADDFTDSVIRIRIFYALKRANIPLSIPAYSTSLTEEAKKQQEIKEEHERKKRVEILSKINLFQVFSKIELEKLAEHMRYAPFCSGEMLTKQGAKANWLYIITSGLVSVRVAITTLNEKIDKEILQLKAEQIFGEMSLMTGEPRSATLIALTDVECYRLDKEAVQHIMTNRPEIVEEISRILEESRASFQIAVKQISTSETENNNEQTKTNPASIVDLIRNFFGI